MTNEEWNEFCINQVKRQFDDKFTRMRVNYFNGEVFEVWSCKTLQNRKSIYAAGGDNKLLFEITSNGDKKETYVDVYNKIDNREVKYID